MFITVLIPIPDYLRLERTLKYNIENGNGIVVYDKFSGGSARAIGYSRYLANKPPWMSDTIFEEYMVLDLYCIEVTGRIKDFGYLLGPYTDPNMNVLYFVDKITKEEKYLPIVPNSIRYTTKLSGAKYKHYLNISNESNYYNFFEDSEFYRIFGISDIIGNLITANELIDGLFLVHFFASDPLGNIKYDEQRKKSYTPIVYDAHFNKYVLDSYGKLDYLHYTHDYIYNKNNGERFSNVKDKRYLDSIYKRIPVELCYDYRTDRIIWRFVELLPYSPSIKDSYISSIPIYFDYKDRNIEYNRYNHYSLAGSFISDYQLQFSINEYDAKLYVYTEAGNELKKMFKLPKAIDLNKYLNEIRLFLLSGVVGGIQAYMMKEEAGVDYQSQRVEFIGHRNRIEKNYFSVSQNPQEISSGIISNRNEIMKLVTFPGEYLIYNGPRGNANYQSSSFYPQKEFEEFGDNKDFKKISPFGSVFSTVDLFNYRLMYIPNI